MPSAITLVRWVNENAFASMVQTRPIPPLADRFIAGATPIDYGPGLLLMPFGFHLAVDTLPSSIFLEASEALPPPLDTVLPIRAPMGLQPT